MLESYSQNTLDGRKARGEQILAIEGGDIGELVFREDRESAAKDAISDILTALYGPAGKFVERIEMDWDVQDNARSLIHSALDAYFNDAEDYIEIAGPELAATDIVVVRDPDFSNEIKVFGGDANIVDIDVGADDLRDPEEFKDWAEGLEETMKRVSTKDAQALIVETVASYADIFGHEVPEWAR